MTGAPGKILTAMAGGSAALIAATGLAAVLSLVFRYRRAQAAERAQLRWLVYAGALIVAAFLAETLAAEVIGPGAAANNLQNAMGSGAAALIPVAIGIAVLRYRLYDIDRIISRTVAYAIVTGLLVGVYAGLVLLATEVLRVHTPVAVAVATLAAAALFTPVRRRVQRRVDRQFNRARYDADQIAAAFAARLKDTVDLSSVRDDLTGIVSRALEPAHVSVWISGQGGPDQAAVRVQQGRTRPASCPPGPARRRPAGPPGPARRPPRGWCRPGTGRGRFPPPRPPAPPANPASA